jgi:K+-transporting ATPase c subunit
LPAVDRSADAEILQQAVAADLVTLSGSSVDDQHSIKLTAAALEACRVAAKPW